MSQQINLITRQVSGVRRTATTRLVSAVAAAAVLSALVGVYEHYQADRARVEAAAVRLALKEARAKQASRAAEKGTPVPDTARDAELRTLLAQVQRRQDVIDALNSGSIGSRSGFSEFMRAFSRQSLEGVWLTGFEIDAGGRDLTLSGRSLGPDLLPRYMERLNREPLMQGRQFSSLHIEQRAAQTAAATAAPAQNPAVAPAESAPQPSTTRRAAPRFIEFSMSTRDHDPAAPASAGSAAPAMARIPAASVIARDPPPAAAAVVEPSEGGK